MSRAGVGNIPRRADPITDPRTGEQMWPVPEGAREKVHPPTMVQAIGLNPKGCGMCGMISEGGKSHEADCPRRDGNHIRAKLEFWAIGRPRTKQTNIGKGRAYSNPKTKMWENAVRAAAMMALSDDVTGLFGPGYTGMVRCDLLLVFPLPESKGVAWKREALAGFHVPNHADVDNMEKAVLDGLKRAVFKDDRQVVGGTKWKVFGKTPRGKARITLYALDRLDVDALTP